ncbi:MAG: DUF2920 family protein [Pseudomonadota bacterium]
MADQTLTFRSLKDVEQGEKGSRSCKVSYATPAGPAKGLALVIPGFGEDVDDDYNTMLRRHISGKHGLVAATVDYHCMHARPPVAGVQVDDSEHASLIGQLVLAGRPELADVKSPTQTLKNGLGGNVAFEIRGNIVPPNGDFQNFGVLQAIDHIHAVYALQDRGVDFDPATIVAIGTSHGGYIAHLIAKFAPNLLSGIIDNSAYTQCSPNYVGADFECKQSEGQGTLFLRTQTKWQLVSPQMPGYFGPAQFSIRDLATPEHLRIMREKSVRPCKIRMLNSTEDGISPLTLKERKQNHLVKAGFDATLDRITHGHIDNDMIKNLGHGMGAALNRLFDRYYPSLSPGTAETDRDLNTDIAFDCVHSRYRFQHALGAEMMRFTYREDA